MYNFSVTLMLRLNPASVISYDDGTLSANCYTIMAPYQIQRLKMRSVFFKKIGSLQVVELAI